MSASARDASAPATSVAPATTEPPLLRVRNLGVAFRVDRHQSFAAVRGISFDIPRERVVALVGESGSGKSVSALAILRLLPVESSSIDARSEVLLEGRDLMRVPMPAMRAVRGVAISMIFQEPMSSLNPVFPVGFQLAEVLRLHLGMAGRSLRRRAIELLDEVGIAEPGRRIDAYPSELSGGQQQRVMIAMAIACQPKLLIADEPTTALDVTIQKQILELIRELQLRHRMSVLFITHDLALVGEIADHVVVMRNGEIREQGSVDDIFDRPRDPYTIALLRCRPRLDRRPMRLPVIEDFLVPAGPDGEPEPAMRTRTAAARPSAGARTPVEPPCAPGAAVAERQRGVSPSDPVVLDVQHLGKSFYSRDGLFGRREFKAVDDVSFRLARGRTLGLVGESGSGKTTVGLTLMRLHAPTAGAAYFEGEDLLAMPAAHFGRFKRRIQIVFQNPYASLNPRFTVGRILVEPMTIHGIGSGEAERRAIALDLLHRVGLPESALGKYPHEFSGGQRQRIAIARCLTMTPDILICDEAVSALDVSVQAQVLNLLQDLQDEFGISYLFISHDLAVVRHISDEIMVMNAGKVVEIAGSDELYRNPRHPYTQRLLAAIPKVRQATRRGGRNDDA